MKKLLLPLLLLFVSIAQAQIEKVIPDPTVPPRLVVDFTSTLTFDQRESLESKLVAYDDSTSNQIVVVIVPSTGDYDISDYAVALGRKWGVGGKEFNNGIVFLIAKNDRKVWIATGYGLEGAIPDITAKTIIDNEVVPKFRGDDFYRGISNGIDGLIKAAAGEYKAPAGYRNRGKKDGPGNIIGLIVIFIIIIFIISRRGGGGRGGSFMSRRGYRNMSGPIFFPPLGGGGWGGSSGGGGGGGGFGGFGGGSFGGGGAGGSW